MSGIEFNAEKRVIKYRYATGISRLGAAHPVGRPRSGAARARTAQMGPGGPVGVQNLDLDYLVALHPAWDSPKPGRSTALGSGACGECSSARIRIQFPATRSKVS